MSGASPRRPTWSGESFDAPSRSRTGSRGSCACTVEGRRRTIMTAVGLEMPEEIITIDDVGAPIRLPRSLRAGLQFHLGVIDVIELGAEDSLCVYSTTAEPDTLALLIAGGTAGALDEIARSRRSGRGGPSGTTRSCSSRPTSSATTRSASTAGARRAPRSWTDSPPRASATTAASRRRSCACPRARRC